MRLQMNYVNFQIYKPSDAIPNKLYWSTEDNIDWVDAKIVIDTVGLDVIVYTESTGKILSINPNMETFIPTSKSILLIDLANLTPTSIMQDGYLVRKGELVKMTLDELRLEKWEEIKEYRTFKMNDGVFITSLGKWIQTDSVTQFQIACLHQRMLAGRNPGTVKWKMKDNSFVVLTDELISEIFDTILNYVQAVFTSAEGAYQFLYMEDDVDNFDYKKFFPNSYSDN